MKAKLVSFSYRDNPTPPAARVFDLRELPNPFNLRDFKAKTGKDEAVQAWLLKYGETHTIVGLAVRAVEQGQDIIAFGCYGGKHRSPALVEIVAERLVSKNIEVEVEHRNIR